MRAKGSATQAINPLCTRTHSNEVPITTKDRIARKVRKNRHTVMKFLTRMGEFRGVLETLLTKVYSDMNILKTMNL